MILANWQRNNRAIGPKLIDFEGNVDDMRFSYDSELRNAASGSCFATLNDEFWVIGGKWNKRHVSKMVNCKLTQIMELDFDFSLGGCNTFSNGILFCFPRSDDKSCYSFDGTLIKREASTLIGHDAVGSLGSYQNAPFVTGGFNNKITEILSEGQWKQLQDYPYSEVIFQYASTFTHESAYIIGGYIGSKTSTDRISRYKNDCWSNVGNLKRARHGHAVITIKSHAVTMVVGGTNFEGIPMETEIWNLETMRYGTSQFNETISPTLESSNYEGFGIYLVDQDYCI